MATQVDCHTVLEEERDDSYDQMEFSQMPSLPTEELSEILKSHALNTIGSKYVLIKRIHEYNRFNRSQYKWAQFYDFLLVIDFEATCEENSHRYKHEIIEFPIILYDVSNQRTKDIFHSYIRPVRSPKLSRFCTDLTKIEQKTVDVAPKFPTVLRNVEQWLFEKHQLKLNKLSVVCDCSSDMAKFMRLQCNMSKISVPKWCRHWINLRKTFRFFYKIPFEQKLSLHNMLTHLGLSFEGQCHSGLEDAKNITRIVDCLLKDHCVLRINERLSSVPIFFTSPVSMKEAKRLLYSMDDKYSGNNQYKLVNEQSSRSTRRDREIEETDRILAEETEQSLGDLAFWMNLKSQSINSSKNIFS